MDCKRGWITPLVPLLVLCELALAQEPSDPVQSDLVEEQVVELAEVRILVTNSNDQPVADLTSDEIRVFEGGIEQRIAFIESVSGSREKSTHDSIQLVPAPMQTTNGLAATRETALVLPAKAVRRVVLAFDIFNSRQSVLEGWREAALSWLDKDMLPEDRVGIVLLGNYPKWWIEFTDDAERLQAALRDVRLKSSARGRDRNHEMSMLMTEVRECFQGDASGTTSRGGGAICAYDTVRPHVHRWNAEAEGSLSNLGSLVGQLAAVPGRKAVLLFSDGFLADPSMMAIHAIVAGLGSSGYNLDMEKMRTRLGKDLHHELAELGRHARAADVSFFTLSAKRGSETRDGGDLGHDQARPVAALGVDPWKDANAFSRHTLVTMARETGGRSYEGARKLTANLHAAVDSFFGMYTVGYYRAEPGSRALEVRVTVDRDGVTVTYPERGGDREPVATTARVEMVVGKPRSGVSDERLILPLAARIAFDSLPLRTSGGSTGTVLGIYFRAMQPDGTVFAERLDVETVGVDTDKIEKLRTTNVVHWSELTLSPGPFRILVRVSDDRQQLIAARAVDLTLENGSVRPSLQAREH